MILVSELMAELVAEMESGRDTAHTLRLTSPPLDAELLDAELLGVAHDSRAVAPGVLFACLRGAASDGHDHAAQAVASGAAALLVDHELPAVDSVAQLVVDDTRRALGPVSSLVYERPSRRLTTVGITGTNGKTTTAQLTAAIFEANGWTTGVVGTLHGARTTPEAPELQQTLATFVDDGASAAVLEVSSHALALHRVDGTEFDAVIFTNLGRDHLDLHGSTEEYFRAKAQLFDPRFAPLALVNTDDPHGRLLADVIAGTDGLRVVELSLDHVSDIEVTTSTHSYTWRGHAVEVPIGGRFNVMNSLSALVVAVELGIDPDIAVAGLATVQAIPGRFESVADAATYGFSVIVDYAHTPDGLAEVLASARAVADTGSAVVVVFGAGGERDRDKRPEMGAVADRLADRVVVTSDNPRMEDPMDIIGDILAGMNRDRNHGQTAASAPALVVEVDRRAAIAAALAGAGPGDVVVIAGKGHERTQDLGAEIIDFDDRIVARQLLEGQA
jgi:UDP-N-acetylmuramoyl-L-alanyl-D-glutamate--2,6-diaminopimelate ligase